jgi:CheY-like chemotaxis protein
MATILLIDDHPDVRDVMCRILCAYGNEVQTCDSAEAAMESLGGTMPDAVIVDDRLSGMSGLDFLRALRGAARTAALPVIVMSADSTRSKDAMTAGATEFWLKGAPWTADRMAQLSERIAPPPSAA